MIDAPTTQVLLDFGARLAVDPSESALNDALRALEPLGVVVDPGGGEIWLEVHGQGRSITLRGAGPQPANELRTHLAHLLRLALQRLAEREERERVHERMEMLSAASFEGLFIHVDGVIIDANQRLCELLGYTREEVLGAETMQRCVAPEDLPLAFERMATRYEGAYVIDGVRKDGSRFRAELQTKQGKLGERPVRVVAVRDVTERERTQALLRESEARLGQLAQSVFDITAYSRDGIILDLIGAVQPVLGYTREQMIGRPVLDFIAPEAVPRMTTVLAENQPGSYQVDLRSSTGEAVPIEVVAIQASLHGRPVRMSALRDLRAERRKEQEQRALEHDLARSQRLESLGVLAGGVAHDFNNLLAGVLGNAELLLAHVRDPRDAASAQNIIEAATRAARLTGQLLAYAGRKELGPRMPLDLGEVLSELRTLLDAALSKKARVELSIEPGSVVLANRATLTQVLMNLLTNASDALGERPGTIEVRAARVSEPGPRFEHAVGVKVQPGEWILLEVRDTGAGMDAATLARVFEPFFTTKPRGHGLGLAACVGIVASHGGAIAVHSEPGCGSTFSVLLPAFRAAQAPKVAPAPAARPGSCKVLVVDDEPLLRAHLRRALSMEHYEVLEAGSGQAALELLEREQPALMVLDMTMPDLSGLEVLREIRGRGLRLPVVLSSGYHDAALDLESAAYQGFLVKPYTLAELFKTVATALEAGR